MKILWVEDEPQDNVTFADVLSRRQAVVRFAGNVQEAMSLISSEAFDLIIVDLNIPLGPDAGEDLVDSSFNGKYVIAAAQVQGGARVICLTNFWEDAAQELRGHAVEIVPKSIYLSEFEKIVYGR